jgi:hypothetical protein
MSSVCTAQALRYWPVGRCCERQQPVEQCAQALRVVQMLPQSHQQFQICVFDFVAHGVALCLPYGRGVSSRVSEKTKEPVFLKENRLKKKFRGVSGP